MNRTDSNFFGVKLDIKVHTVRGVPLVKSMQFPALFIPKHRLSFVDFLGRQFREVFSGMAIGALLGFFCALVFNFPIGYSVLLGAVIVSLVTKFVSLQRNSKLFNRKLKIPVSLIDSEHPKNLVAEHLRVMLYNVHGGMGGPGKYLATKKDFDCLAAKIRELQPDILLLQELDNFALRSNFTDTLARLASRLKPDGAVMTPEIEKIYGRREGTGVMTFNGVRIADARGIRIPDGFGEGTRRRFSAIVDSWASVVAAKWKRNIKPFGGVAEYQPRVVTDAIVVTAKGNEIRVISGHFSSPRPGVDEPRRQIGPIIASLESYSGPTIFGADFNTWNGSAEHAWERAALGEAGMSEATEKTPPKIDRIYVSNAHFISKNAQKVATPTGERVASDHDPITVELAIK